MTDELRTERNVWVKYKDILVIPLACIPQEFDKGNLTDTMNGYLRYVNETGAMPVQGEILPQVLTFNSAWLNNKEDKR